MVVRNGVVADGLVWDGLRGCFGGAFAVSVGDSDGLGGVVECDGVLIGTEFHEDIPGC
ncbi:hypothetical protein [Corynebacterium sp. c7Ub_26]